MAYLRDQDCSDRTVAAVAAVVVVVAVGSNEGNARRLA